MSDPASAQLLQENLAELAGVFFTNHYWVAIYRTADKNLKDEELRNAKLPTDKRPPMRTPEKRAQALEAHYSNALDSYRQAASGAQYMNSQLTELHKFCCVQAEVQCSFMDFIDLCVQVIMPPNSYREIQAKHDIKISTFRAMLVKVLLRFTHYITSGWVPRLCALARRVDPRDPRAAQHNGEKQSSMEQCKAEFLRIFTVERAELCSHISATQYGIQDTSTGTKEMNTRLSEQLRAVLQREATLAAQCQALQQAWLVAKDLVLEKDRIIEEQAARIRAQHGQQKAERQLTRGLIPQIRSVVPPQGGPMGTPVMPQSQRPPAQPVLPVASESVPDEPDPEGETAGEESDDISSLVHMQELSADE
jgi:hypothetical protein